MIDIQNIKLIDIETTSHCNLHCPQCDRFDLTGKENKYMELKHLDFARLRDNLNLDKLVSLETILLEGDHGDPLMHPDILDIIGFFKDIKQVKLVTNASLRSVSWWQQLAKIKNLVVTFSIDGLEDTLDFYRINADFDKVIANATAFIQSGGRAIWKYVVFQHNEHQVDRARQLAQELGFEEFETDVSNRNFYNKQEFPIFVDGIYQNRNLKIASTTRARPTTKDIMIKQEESSTFKSPECRWLKSGSVYIDYCGNLIPCCMTSGLMWRKDISAQLWQKIVGDLDSINLYKNDLSTILDSKFYQEKLQNSFREIRTVHHICVGNCS